MLFLLCFPPIYLGGNMFIHKNGIKQTVLLYLIMLTESEVKTIRNIVGICIPAYTLYCVWNYRTSQDIEYLVYNASAILAQMVFDFGVYHHLNSDILFHHVCATGLLYSLLGTSAKQHMADIAPQIVSVLQTEYSTFFLTISIYLPKVSNKIARDTTNKHITTTKSFIVQRISGIATSLNYACFILLFIYTRIYVFSQKIVFDESYSTYMASILPIHDRFVYTASLYGLYFLNLYWGGIIIKTVFKPYKNIPFFEAVHCETALQYTMFPPLLMSIYYYTKTSNTGRWVYAIDITGQAMLSVTSYLYHRSLKNELLNIYPNTNVDVLDAKILWTYLDDVSVVNMRSFLNLVTFLVINNGEHKCVLILASGMIHVVSMYTYIRYIVSEKLGGNQFSLTETHGKKSLNINTLTGLPVCIDILCGCIYANHETQQRIILCFALCVIVLHIRPVYQVSHLLFHFVIWYQTYCLVNANI